MKTTMKMALLVSALAAFATPAHAQPVGDLLYLDGFEFFSRLNDTGQNGCANSGTIVLIDLPCPQAGFPRQDGDLGRDALARSGSLAKIGGGEAGFDFTKISNSGASLPASAGLGSGPNDWACTRDNATGLFWEVKIDSAPNLRHVGHRYTWFSTDFSSNGGASGLIGGPGSCSNTLGLCNTQAYVAAINALDLCGFSDWRMPDQFQLQAIVSQTRTMLTLPAVDPTYFPNTRSSFYWTGTHSAGGGAWAIAFARGEMSFAVEETTHHIRLVRSGQ
jgi:hypothetical protein